MSSLLDVCDEIAENYAVPFCRAMTRADREKALEYLSGIARVPYPSDFIPYTGVACVCDGLPWCVIPVYLENTTKTAVLGYCTFAPELSPKQKYQAAEAAINYSLQYVRSLGKRYVLALFGNRAVNHIADRIGFVSTDKNVEEKFYFLK